MFNIAVHGHFYQPPREDPVTGLILPDESAFPFHDWNERIFNECYLPVSEAKLPLPGGVSAVNGYSMLSFDIGPTLHRWIESRSPELNEKITSSGRRAIAQCYNHIIMPLASPRDKRTQIVWGIRDFEYRFGRRPKGMWLPETAADTETLDILAQEGILFTILAQRQCRAVNVGGTAKPTPGGIGVDVTLPYRCDLPSGRSISIVFYDGGISHDIAFGGLLDNADEFYGVLLRRARAGAGRILAVATDGETYGHHHKFGEMALARLFKLIGDNRDICLPDIGEFIEQNPPSDTCFITENSSWSCIHGIERWRADCGCRTGGEAGWNQKWRAPLRDAFDSLREKIDEIYEKRMAFAGDPWKIRDEAAELYFSERRAVEYKEKFIKEHFENCSAEDISEAMMLLEVQRMRMFMYTSCGWFFNDIGGVETRQVISYAVRAAELCGAAGGEDLLSPLLRSLASVRGNTPKFPTARAIAERYLAASNGATCGRVGEKDGESRKTAVWTMNKATEGGHGMAVMNYGSNLAQSLLSTLERDPAFRNVAYFSMEIGLMPEIPTYSGGLGVLAGDILKSAAD
ncbi:MAG: DUF3536 domain-containing protein, partial [Synergistaceae bacterium]